MFDGLITTGGGPRALLGGPELERLRVVEKRLRRAAIEKADLPPRELTPRDQRLLELLAGVADFEAIMTEGGFGSVDEAIKYVSELAPGELASYLIASFLAEHGDGAPPADLIQPQAGTERLV